MSKSPEKYRNPIEGGKAEDKLSLYFGPSRGGVSLPEANLQPWDPQTGTGNYELKLLTFMTPYQLANLIRDEILRSLAEVVPSARAKLSPEGLSAIYEADRAAGVSDGRLGYFMMEVCGGLGGNTLSFLDTTLPSPPGLNLYVEVVYEANPDRQRMLVNNLQAFKLLDPQRVYSYGAFPGEEGMNAKAILQLPRVAARPSVLYFDPPWLSEEDSLNVLKISADKTRKKYLRSGITLGGRTMEAIVQEFIPLVDLIVIRFPPSYLLGAIEGLTYERKFAGTAEQGLFYYIYKDPEYKKKSLKIVRDDGGVVEVLPKKEPSGNRAARDKKILEEARAELPAQLDRDAYPYVNPGGNVQTKEEEELWWVDLSRFLVEFIGKFLPAGVAPPEYFMQTPEQISVWKRAFTPNTYYTDVNENYEVLESIGDRFLKANFRLVLLERMPDASESLYGEFENRYLAKSVFHAFSTQYGFPRYFRSVDVIPTISTDEDLLESFAGALLRAGDALRDSEGRSSSGLGNILVNYFVQYMFPPKYKFQENYRGTYKTQVKEIFEGLGWVDKPTRDETTEIIQRALAKRETMEEEDLTTLIHGVIENIYREKRTAIEKRTRESNGNFRVSIYLNKSAIATIRRMARNFKINRYIVVDRQIQSHNAMLSSVSAPNETDAEDMAYAKAQEQLDVWGFSLEVANATKQFKLLQMEETRPYQEQFIETLRRDGFDSFEFSKVKKEKSKVPFTILYGVKGIQVIYKAGSVHVKASEDYRQVSKTILGRSYLDKAAGNLELILNYIQSKKEESQA